MRLSLTAQLALDVAEGRKCDTFRKVSRTLPTAGELLTLCVNAGRRDILKCRITSVRIVEALDLSEAKRQQLAALKLDEPRYLVLGFKLVEVCLDEIRRQNLKAFGEFLSRPKRRRRMRCPKPKCRLLFRRSAGDRRPRFRCPGCRQVLRLRTSRPLVREPDKPLLAKAG